VTDDGREITATLSYRPPFDWESLIAFLGTRAIPRVEAVTGAEYRRTIDVDGAAGVVRVFPGKRNQIDVSAPEQFAPWMPSIADRIATMFDLAADPQRIGAQFAADPLLAPIAAKWPGIRIPGAWDAFEICVRAIVGQQISVAGARTILGRIAAKYGTHLDGGGDLDVIFPVPARIARARIGGMPGSRSATIRELAARFAKREPDPGTLTSIRGIGPWTASYIRMRAFADRDAFPAADLGLRKAAGGIGARDLEQMSERWRPWRAYAAMLLWRSL
jgi:AraC family transcriptional regulator of adaptative response / DNA-3-methyladenine glycosylase II